MFALEGPRTRKPFHLNKGPIHLRRKLCRIGGMNTSLLAKLFFIVATASSLSLLPVQLPGIESQEGSQSSTGSGLLLPSHGSIMPPNSSFLNVLFTKCSATKFGSPLNPPSCLEAISKIKWNSTQLTFRDRADDSSSFDIGLPYRTLSCRRSHNIIRAFIQELASAAIRLTHTGSNQS